MVTKNPYPTAAHPARTQPLDTQRGAYGTSMPNLDTAADEKPDIDPILLKVLDAVPFRLSLSDGVEVARRQLHNLPQRPFHPDLRVEDRGIAGPDGTVPIRIYWPPADAGADAAAAADAGADATKPSPVVMYFHGGGFVLGDLHTHDGICRQHAVGTGAIVVSVDYRLAPEYPYPAAVEDTWAATRWVAAHGAGLGGDPERLALAGDSAGGTLAAVIAQRARDLASQPGPHVVFQLLWYPSAMWDVTLPSFAENAHAPVLDADTVAAFSRFYAGDVDLRNPPPGMAPGRADNLTGLAAAYIAVAGHDPLRDDGIRYGELMAAAGVPVTVDNDPGLVHGYLGYAGVVPAATAAMERGLAALREALHR